MSSPKNSDKFFFAAAKSTGAAILHFVTVSMTPVHNL